MGAVFFQGHSPSRLWGPGSRRGFGIKELPRAQRANTGPRSPGLEVRCPSAVRPALSTALMGQGPSAVPLSVPTALQGGLPCPICWTRSCLSGACPGLTEVEWHRVGAGVSGATSPGG